jgi:hypothetical protein
MNEAGAARLNGCCQRQQEGTHLLCSGSLAFSYCKRRPLASFIGCLPSSLCQQGVLLSDYEGVTGFRAHPGLRGHVSTNTLVHTRRRAPIQTLSLGTSTPRSRPVDACSVTAHGK